MENLEHDALEDLTDAELLQRGSQEASDFFNQFSYVHELLDGHYSTALDQGISLLNKLRSLDASAYERIHKGTPFYWLGTASFRVHDYQTAAFFFDAAVAEDLRFDPQAMNRPTAGLRFVQLEGEPLDQAARGLVQVAQARVEDVLQEYNAMTGRPPCVPDLSMADIRKQFLGPAVSPVDVRNQFLGPAVSPLHKDKKWRSLATAFISFFLEWDYRNMLLDLRPGEGTVEPFFIHLFKGCVLFESLLKRNPQRNPAGPTLGSVLQELHSELGIPCNLKIGGVDFQTILQDVRAADKSIQTAITFTGKIRNTVGHDLGWEVHLDKHDYHRLFRMVASSCLHAIACLYR